MLPYSSMPKQLLNLKTGGNNLATKRNSFGFGPALGLGPEDGIFLKKDSFVRLPDVETRKDIPMFELDEKFTSRSALKRHDNPFTPKNSQPGHYSSMAASSDGLAQRKVVLYDREKKI